MWDNNLLYLQILLEIILHSLRNMINKDIKQYVNFVNLIKISNKLKEVI